MMIFSPEDGPRLHIYLWKVGLLQRRHRSRSIFTHLCTSLHQGCLSLPQRERSIFVDLCPIFVHLCPIFVQSLSIFVHLCPSLSIFVHLWTKMDKDGPSPKMGKDGAKCKDVQRCAKMTAKRNGTRPNLTFHR